MKIHQDAVLSRIDIDKGQSFNDQLKIKNHGVYAMTIHGDFSVDDIALKTRDAIGISDTEDFTIKASEDSELLLIEVPMI